MKRKQVVLYTRWSKRTKRIYHSENSLEGQKSELLEFCKLNNYDVVAHFEDELTGSNPYRSKWMELERFVYENVNEIDEVVMVCSSRCSTAMGTSIEKFKQFQSIGITMTDTRDDKLDMARMELMLN